MDFTINSKRFGPLTFWMPINGGYIRLVTRKTPGTLGRQICSDGKFTGSSLSGTDDTFVATCKKWYRAYTKECIRSM